ncbi:MAG: right-handed parallel beta-helix repeat-containing protein [Deltaproteobacteria bacterium]|nr:right-handed parallel beta-helix repeat-containing protein [Deltaproteobacteria bacterium]
MNARLLILVLVMAVALTTAASADTIIVNGSGGGDYTLIQDGIDAASDGDTVLVMPGTYSGAGNRNLDFFATDCVLASSGGARSVTIDCGGETRGFYFGGIVTAACVVDGFTITNGYAQFGPGGGMYIYNCSPTIRNCVITANVTADWGGGVYCTGNAGPSFTGCTFSNNQAQFGAGASCAANTTPSFDGCTFSDNTAAWGGGGIYLNGCSPSFYLCDFDGNSVTDAYSHGGGMLLVEGASPTLFECDFYGNTTTSYGGAVMVSTNSEPSFTSVGFGNNTAEYGAAVAINNPLSPSFDACRFYDNAAVHAGGAVQTDSGAAPTFEDCVFDGNTAGATGGAAQFEFLSIPIMNHCTLYANSAPEGSGVWCDSGLTLTNSIIAFGLVGEAVYCDGAPPFSSCSDIYGNAGGDWVGCLDELIHIENNFSEDPLFCDAPGGDFTIDVASPCTAANAPACGLVGAWDIGCDTPVQAESWGAIKAMYR